MKIVRLQPNGGALGKLIRVGLEMPGAHRGMSWLLSPSGLDHFMLGPRTFGADSLSSEFQRRCGSQHELVLAVGVLLPSCKTDQAL